MLTGHNHGKTQATEITHRSGVPSTTGGNAHKLASRGAGTPSGRLVFIRSINHVNGFIANPVVIIYNVKDKQLKLYHLVSDRNYQYPLY
jgi:hypothetical protein